MHALLAPKAAVRHRGHPVALAVAAEAGLPRRVLSGWNGWQTVCLVSGQPER